MVKYWSNTGQTVVEHLAHGAARHVAEGEALRALELHVDLPRSKYWSKYWLKIGQILVKHWLNTG